MTSKIDPVVELLRSEPEDVALALLSASNNAKDQKESLQNQLRAVCGELFQRIEVLNGLRGEVAGREEEPPLSGLTELYTGDDEEGGDGVPVDAETLEESGNDSENDDGSSVDDKQVREKESDGESEDDDDDDDEERKKIEARMQRAMEDMDEDDSDTDAPKPRENDEASEEEEEGSLVDPAAEELNDGFFDIHEMEKFADEEEEYLPDEAFGEEKPEKEDDEDKRSFHQKQRDGDLDDSEEEPEDDDNGFLFKKENTVRRKRYRDDDEIDALYQLYQSAVEENDDDEDSTMEATNMTAAELYGKPNKKFYEKWNSKETKRTSKSDDDSWDEYDFEQSKEKKKGNWNETLMDYGHEEEEGGSDEDEDDQAPDEDVADVDEQLPMKSREDENPKGPTKRTDKLQKQTEQLEKEILAEKPWQMRGETTGTARPVDSLLDSTPEFEVATKQAPIITVEKTMDLEEVIKQRILNEDWDDVIPRELPDVGWNKKRGELPEVSQEKSKLGLGELYEREYTKKALGYDADAAEKETEEEKAKNEIKSLFASLCSKLDALSNYHFAPRPIADEAEIRPLTKPAIAMEEVLPLHVSEARGVAPEEVYGAKRGRDAVVRGESEFEQEDRKRMRSAKKAARRKARKEKVADEKLISKLQPGLGLNNPYEKRKMREELSVARAQGKITTGAADMNDYGKSTTFFKRMQQEAQQSIKGTSSENMDFDEGGKRRSKSNAVKL
eukprot:scaffold425_cov175-Amphora_coffeaeformis.AAC.36